MQLNVFCALVTLCIVQYAQGARILVAAPFGTKSHQNVYFPIVNALAQRGHNVTVISNYHNKNLKSSNNIREVLIEELTINMSEYPNFFDVVLNPSSVFGLIWVVLQSMMTVPTKIVRHTYSNAQVIQIMAEESFDLVMISETCAMSVAPMAWHFQAPFIIMGPNTLYPGIAELLGDEDNYSYVPFFMSSFTDRMNFVQRCVNTIATRAYEFLALRLPRFFVRNAVKEIAFSDCPPIEDILKNTSLVFTNAHPVINYARSLPPQVIEVGGMHCKKAERLPEELEKFIGNSDFVLFAVGSAIPMTDMPEYLIHTFIDVFKRLNVKVIWQWPGQPPTNMPPNILALPWLPQQDLLGHPHCRAFITHGGLNSLQEAVYHGVPLLGMPFGTDQKLNIGKAKIDGFAIQLNWIDVNDATLTKALSELLQNSSFSGAARKLSSLYRDQQQTPLDRAVYWSEFIIRHKSAHHMKIGSRHLAPFQRSLIDVYIVLFVILLAPVFITVLIFRSWCCKRTSLVYSRSKKDH